MNRLFLLLFGAVSLVAHAQVPDYVPTDGLVAWYPFNGNANDESGNGQHGSMTDIQIVEDRYDTPNAAFEFNGSSSFVQVESTPSLSVSSAYTLSAWFNNHNWSFDAPIDEHAIVSKVYNGGYSGGYEIYTGGEYGAGMLRHIGNINGNFGPWTAGLAELTWYHVVASFNGSIIEVYINGESVATQNRSGSLQTSSTPLRIGRRGGAGSFNSWFQGIIDDVGIWNRALTNEEILALYNAQPLSPGCTDPTACNFNEEANENDGSCTYPPFGLADCEVGGTLCGEGTIWDASLQTCVGFDDCPADLNGNGLVEVSDLLMVLADFGEICEQSTDDELSCEPVSYQGYEYATVAIAGNCWFAENLRADSYRNGDVIETLTGSTSQDCDLYYGGIGLAGVYGETWGCSSDCTDSFDACSDNTNSLNAFGRYYNGHAIVDPRGLCPSGWHPSTDEEWIELEVFAGITQAEAETFGNRGSIAPLLKNSELWCDDNSGTDELGFMAVPAGSIFDDCGASVGAMGEGRWWSLSEAGDGISRTLNAGDSGIWRGGVYGFEDMFSGVQNMLSVRCVQD